MKRCYFTSLLAFVLIPILISAGEKQAGKIVLKEGTVLKTNINCTDSRYASDLYIRKGDRIRTGKDSRAQLLLADGTGLIIYERSDIIINNVKDSDNKKITLIYADYGKFKIIQNNNYMETSLVIRTKTSVIKTVQATFCLIASEDESGIFVSTGEAGFANIESSVSEAFVIKEGEESFISRGKAPSVPGKISASLQSSWLSRMILSRDGKHILRSGIENGPLDWPFMKKD